jgi:hypothetical protein
MRILLGAVAAAVALSLAPAAGAAETPKSETATGGTIGATLTFTMPTSYRAHDVKLAITRAGTPAAVDRAGAVQTGCEICTDAVPTGALGGEKASSMTIADLQGDGEDEVIVDLFTGGAHCCFVSAIYGWDAASSSYRRLTWLWGDPGYSLEQLDGGPARELVTADDRFAYAFCAYVCSAMPPQAYRYDGTALVDVTKQYPALVRPDARQLQASVQYARRHKGQAEDMRGVLPALCADYYLIGQGAKCKPLLNDALRRGWLRKDPAFKGGRAYIDDVLAQLHKWGYR